MKKLVLIFNIVAISIILQSGLNAALKSDQVAIITVDSPASKEIAQYYALARHVPRENILTLSIPETTDLDRSKWEREIRPQIRSWLLSDQNRGKIRCLVTTYGCPLRISQAAQGGSFSTERLIELNRLWQVKLSQTEKAILAFNNIAVSKKSSSTEKLSTSITVKEIAEKVEQAMKMAQLRIHIQSPGLQKRLAIPFQQAFVTMAGVKGLYQNIQSNADKLPESQKAQLPILAAEIRSAESSIAEQQMLPVTSACDFFISLNQERLGGLFGSLQWLESQLNLAKTNETQAAFDSELILILLPDHELNRWLINPLYYGAGPVMRSIPAMMVARLEGPSPDIVKQRIDQGLKAEQSRLAGKVYLDARSYRKDGVYPPGSYERYDQSLYELSQRLRNNTKMEVVYESTALLFESKACPDTAIYVGWYSLGKYVPSCSWNPGSIGCHLASSEACSLRDPNSPLWCPQILKNGGAATVGPTFEPYLGAFPMPDDFISLILTGEYTMAEAYSISCPYASWAMILIGDPLYTPYKINPPLGKSDLPEPIKTGLGIISK